MEDLPLNCTDASAFYDQRYLDGYLEDWDAAKKRKIAEVLREIGLPNVGTALDFGCGNGVLTNVLQQTLPAWRVFGTDISPQAVANATLRYPHCSFFNAGEDPLIDKGVDLLFTHHVLEHVEDLEETFSQIDRYVRQGSVILHILPCGNPGSYEYRICQLIRDGIDANRGNRFFFEEPGHLRRLDAQQLDKMLTARGYIIQQKYYCNQRDGAIEWITRAGPGFVRLLTDRVNAVDEPARKQLKRHRLWLLLLATLRFPFLYFRSKRQKQDKSTRDWVFIASACALSIVAYPVDSVLERRAEREWHEHRTERNGSEMFAVFRRAGAD